MNGKTQSLDQGWMNVIKEPKSLGFQRKWCSFGISKYCKSTSAKQGLLFLTNGETVQKKTELQNEPYYSQVKWSQCRFTSWDKLDNIIL